MFSPFIVCTRDEAAARKLCQRSYFLLQSVEPYIEQEGTEKPRILPYGPPVSDRDFERDYGSRPEDYSTPSSPLSSDDSTNYRNVRAVAMLFVVFGSVLVLGGVGLALDESKRSQKQIHLAVAVGIAFVGLAGAIGGVAALHGSRRWAPLVYVMAAVYVFAFPIGTILSAVMFNGLSRYLDYVERVRASGTTSPE